jgi:hypothetical protein
MLLIRADYDPATPLGYQGAGPTQRRALFGGPAPQFLTGLGI